MPSWLRTCFTLAAGVDIQAHHVVCGFEVGTVVLTPSLWARAVAESRRLGRCLSADELQRLVGAEGGQDANH